MTKRIIDSMTAEQIDSGWGTSGPQDLLEYLKKICKPEPNWSADASAENPILCWVSDNPNPRSDGKRYSGVADYVTGLHNGVYQSVEGHCWEHARPIPPNYIWQPTGKGE